MLLLVPRFTSSSSCLQTTFKFLICICTFWRTGIHFLVIFYIFLQAVDVTVMGCLCRDDLKKVCGDNFPEWISFPVYEQVEWLYLFQFCPLFHWILFLWHLVHYFSLLLHWLLYLCDVSLSSFTQAELWIIFLTSPEEKLKELMPSYIYFQTEKSSCLWRDAYCSTGLVSLSLW